MYRWTACCVEVRLVAFLLLTMDRSTSVPVPQCTVGTQSSLISMSPPQEGNSPTDNAVDPERRVAREFFRIDCRLEQPQFLYRRVSVGSSTAGLVGTAAVFVSYLSYIIGRVVVLQLAAGSTVAVCCRTGSCRLDRFPVFGDVVRGTSGCCRIVIRVRPAGRGRAGILRVLSGLTGTHYPVQVLAQQRGLSQVVLAQLAAALLAERGTYLGTIGT